MNETKAQTLNPADVFFVGHTGDIFQISAMTTRPFLAGDCLERKGME